LLACVVLFGQENCEIHLKSPTYENGILSTHEGGVITGPSLRIQAKHITYIHRNDNGRAVQRIKASGDLMANFQDRTYIGEDLTYDFINKQGTIRKGMTVIGPWALEGRQIDLLPKADFIITDATVTTAETTKHLWDIQAKRLAIHDKNYASAKTIQIRVNEFPVFAIPFYQTNLKQFWQDSPVRYKIVWDKGQGPRLTTRYRMYSTDDFEAYARLDYRLRRGIGGAIETNYYAPSGRGHFLTKNYLAYDTFFNDNNPNHLGTRYRLQGQYHYSSFDLRTEIVGSWDKISDQELPGDFHMEDFELNIQKLTRFFLRHQENNTIVNLTCKPRINDFDSLKQELPQLQLSMRPISIRKLGIISENRVKVGYLDYVYADEIDQLVSDFSSFRMQAKHELYRPFTVKGLSATPIVGIDGVYYQNSPDSNPVGQFILNYGLDISCFLTGKYPKGIHVLQPYANYKGITTPTADPSEVYIFSIHDGFFRINQLRAGFKNLFFTSSQPVLPKLTLDIYAYGFFWDRTYNQHFPKAFLEMRWNFPRFTTQIKLGWNFEENVLDVGNVRAAWTVNEFIALSGEFRHRSRFYWKKADLENYIIDFVRPIEELLNSPLSDGRNVALLTLQVQLAPEWTLRAQTHYGWGRSDEPGYAEAKVDLLGLISSSWRVRMSYTHTVRDDRLSFGISLVRK
jgi:hypothetical protein